MTHHEMELFQRFYYIVETLKIHGEITYGTSDINVEALVNYLNHPSFTLQCWDAHNVEDIEAAVIEDIMNGMPVWMFYHLSPWAQEMQRRDYEAFRKEEEARAAKQLEEDRKIYKCLQGCVHYDYGETSLGIFVRCKAKHVGGDDFKLCKRCAHFSSQKHDSLQPDTKQRLGG